MTDDYQEAQLAKARYQSLPIVKLPKRAKELSVDEAHLLFSSHYSPRNSVYELNAGESVLSIAFARQKVGRGFVVAFFCVFLDSKLPSRLELLSPYDIDMSSDWELLSRSTGQKHFARRLAKEL